MVKNKPFKIIKNLREHWFVFPLAFIGGILVAVPMIVSVLNLGLPGFKGVFPVFNPDKIIYMSMTKEVVDGHPGLGNPFIKEHKDMPFMNPPVSEIFLASIAKFFHISIPTLFAFNDFVLPFIEILLLYYLFFQISANKKLSGFFSLSYIILFLAKFAMPMNPQLSFIYLTIGVIFIWKMVVREYDAKSCVWLNVGLGLIFTMAFYTYPYFWTGILVLYGMSLLIFSLKEKNLKKFIGNILPFFLVSSVLAVPYFINMFNALSTGFYESTASRFGLYANHFPACFVNVSFVFLMSFVLFLGYEFVRDKRKFYFSISLLASTLILNWQNVITGKTMQLSSHYFQLTIFYCLIVLLILLKYVFGDKNFLRKSGLKKISFIFGIFVFLVVLVYEKVPQSYARLTINSSKEKMQALQGYDDVFSWFNNNTELDSSVFVLNNPRLNLLMPVYTHNNVLHVGYASQYLMSDEEAKQRWLINNIFNKNIDDAYFEKGNVQVWNNKYVNEYQNAQVRRKIIDFMTGKRRDYDNKFLPEDVIDDLKKTNNEIRNDSLENVFRYFEIDFLVIDKKVEGFQTIKDRVEEVSYVKLEQELDDFLVFRLED